jgi:hypothetical protein
MTVKLQRELNGNKNPAAELWIKLLAEIGLPATAPRFQPIQEAGAHLSVLTILQQLWNTHNKVFDPPSWAVERAGERSAKRDQRDCVILTVIDLWRPGMTDEQWVDAVVQHFAEYGSPAEETL